VERYLVGREFKFRLLWFVALRYLATAALVAMALIRPLVPGAIFDPSFLWWVAAGLAIFNTVVLTVLNRVRFADWRRGALWLAHVQIMADFAFLAAILHHTGGIDSPVLLFFLFHAIIASILLTFREALLHAALGVAFVVLVVVMQDQALWVRHPLFHFDVATTQGVAIVIRLFFFVSAMVLTVYMTSSIAREIGTREALVRDTVQRLQMANEELRRQEKIRNQFVRTVAHDLKEPLASIQSTLRVVLDGYTGEVNPKARNMIERADKGAGKLIGMIREMLDLGRMRMGWLGNRTTWPVTRLFQLVDDKLRPQADQHGQTVGYVVAPPDLELHASLDAFEQVLLNLVSNGLKYSEPGSPVRSRVERREGTLTLSVEDEGIGIPEGARDQLFSEFFRADNARRLSREGTGLGLSIVKSIIEQHGGSIDVESPYGSVAHGTRVTARFPMKELLP